MCGDDVPDENCNNTVIYIYIAFHCITAETGSKKVYLNLGGVILIIFFMRAFIFVVIMFA